MKLIQKLKRSSRKNNGSYKTLGDTSVANAQNLKGFSVTRASRRAAAPSPLLTQIQLGDFALEMNSEEASYVLKRLTEVVAEMKESEAKQVTVNREQGVYVIPENGGGYTCLGFNICQQRVTRLSAELGLAYPPAALGSIEAYNNYVRLTDAARARHNATGWRSQSELTPELIGLEGKRVCMSWRYDEDDDKIRESKFRVGKSTGFIPCHLFIDGDDDCGCSIGHIVVHSVSVLKG